MCYFWREPWRGSEDAALHLVFVGESHLFLFSFFNSVLKTSSRHETKNTANDESIWDNL